MTDFRSKNGLLEMQDLPVTLAVRRGCKWLIVCIHCGSEALDAFCPANDTGEECEQDYREKHLYNSVPKRPPRLS